jgi:hypothetical protein
VRVLLTVLAVLIVGLACRIRLAERAGHGTLRSGVGPSKALWLRTGDGWVDGWHPLDWPYDGVGAGIGRWGLPPMGSAVSSLTLAARDALSSVHA